MAPAHRTTSLLAVTRYGGASEDSESSTPEARGIAVFEEKIILSTNVFVATVRLGLFKTSGVRYAVAEELPEV